MKLICGLGNPGRSYAGNRHNIGLMVIEALARREGLTLQPRKFEARSAELTWGETRVLLLQPLTFMNLSGGPLSAAATFFKILPLDVLVIHDELDLPFGRLQLKAGGGSGGHHGLDSIIDRWGTSDFARLRFGIGKPNRMGGEEATVSHVLSNFSPQEREKLDPLIATAVEACEAWGREGLASAMNRFNRRERDLETEETEP